MPLPYEATLEEVKARIRASTNNPNVGKIKQIALKEGPRAYRLATLLEILDPASRAPHHYTLKLESIDRTRKSGWFYKPEKSITLEGKDPDEIEKLVRFLTAHVEGKLDSSGELRIIKSEDYDNLSSLIEVLPRLGSPDVVELVKLILPSLKDSNQYISEFVQAFEASSAETVEYFGVAAKFVEHTRAFQQLSNLIDSSEGSEQDYQNLLSKHPWMFGSEYSELLDRRTWTRDNNVDFMLRRTSDNFLEIIEIKTPFSDGLFIHDKSHNSHYPSARLSAVLGQVIHYITEVERQRDSIKSKDGCDTLKIRARIIIGRVGNEQQQDALRAFNGHLHRVEVITFDQLLRMAQRVLNVFDPAQKNGQTTNIEDSPF